MALTRSTLCFTRPKSGVARSAHNNRNWTQTRFRSTFIIGQSLSKPLQRDCPTHAPGREKRPNPPESEPVRDKYGHAYNPWPLEDMERFERYTTGGLLPVKIGDELCGSRYKIVHKLGHGSFSTSWMARDKLTKRYVALKFCIAEKDARHEVKILEALRKKSCRPPAPGARFVRGLLDSFKEEGPSIRGMKGTHQCIITELARSTIAETLDPPWASRGLFQPVVARAIVAQLIQAIAYVHECGIVHGDLHLANILLRMHDNVHDLTTDELYRVYGEPELEEMTRCDGKPLNSWVPTNGVYPVSLGKEAEDIALSEAHILLNDFGESFQPATDTRFQLHTPWTIRPPETFFEKSTSLSYSADIWSLACTIFDILGDGPLFKAFWPTEERMIAEQVEALGLLTGPWWWRWRERREPYDEHNNPHENCTWPRNTLEKRVEDCIQEPRRKAGMPVMDANEEAALIGMLRSMLVYRPDERATAKEVMAANWMVRWGEPALRLTNHGR